MQDCTAHFSPVAIQGTVKEAKKAAMMGHEGPNDQQNEHATTLIPRFITATAKTESLVSSKPGNLVLRQSKAHNRLGWLKGYRLHKKYLKAARTIY